MRTKVSKPDINRQVAVRLRIEQELASPAQKRARQRFWQRLITKVRQSEQEGGDHRLSFLRVFLKS